MHQRTVKHQLFEETARKFDELILTIHPCDMIKKGLIVEL